MARAAEPKGEWKAPAADGSPWKHDGTGLTFPQIMDGYRLAGQFAYADGGTFLRYENVDARARADIFFFQAPGHIEAADDIHRLLLREMDTVESDLRAMAKDGRYKNLQFSDVTGEMIDLWMQEDLPIAIRTLTATRVSGQSTIDEAPIKQWIGITLINGYIVTIRHTRPLDTGDRGEADVNAFIGNVFQVIKDPPLRAQIKKFIADYYADPFTTDSEQAAAAVLAYLQKNPLIPIHVPEHPISEWLDRCKTAAPGTEDHLLRAFMLGSAKAAFEGAGAAASVNEGARQFAKVYRHLVQQSPAIALPDMQPFIAAAEKGDGAAWLRDHD
jgi:hypothetical protein